VTAKSFLASFILVLAGMLRLAAADLRVEVEAFMGPEKLGFDSLRLTNVAGQTFSVGRLDMHLSEIALRDAAGNWSGPSDWFAYLSLREGRNGFTLKGVPSGKYTALRFQVGLPPDVNAADATKHPAGHPLNPSVSTLWWGWSGGYVFFAIEGGWRRPDQSFSGYSYHVATDKRLMTVEIPCKWDLAEAAKVSLRLDVAKVMKGVALSDDQNSTHSREGDEVAALLHRNIEGAFSLASISSGAPAPGETVKTAVKPEGTLVPFSFPSYLPVPQLPGDNPLTKEGIELGRGLFHDRRLSINHRQSCADCHQSQHGLTDGLPVSFGAEGQRGRRNAMPLFNLAWKSSFFWDGRAPSLRQQVLMPVQDPLEMHLPLEEAERRTGLSREKISKSLEQFLLTLVSAEAKFDRVASGKEQFTESESRGFTLFHTEYDPRQNQRGADCFHCHGGPLFQSKPFANNGLDATPKDRGLALTTGSAADEGKFAVPSLRNVALTAPYMHDGRFATLEEVIKHYDRGLQRGETLDPNLAKHPTSGLGLNDQDVADLVAFLRTLTDKSANGR
jgi:cytochrome c peroxidase